LHPQRSAFARAWRALAPTVRSEDAGTRVRHFLAQVAMLVGALSTRVSTFVLWPCGQLQRP
jgi:hypothetical protein